MICSFYLSRIVLNFLSTQLSIILSNLLSDLSTLSLIVQPSKRDLGVKLSDQLFIAKPWGWKQVDYKLVSCYNYLVITLRGIIPKPSTRMRAAGLFNSTWRQEMELSLSKVQKLRVYHLNSHIQCFDFRQ